MIAVSWNDGARLFAGLDEGRSGYVTLSDELLKRGGRAVAEEESGGSGTLHTFD